MNPNWLKDVNALNVRRRWCIKAANTGNLLVAPVIQIAVTLNRLKSRLIPACVVHNVKKDKFLNAKHEAGRYSIRVKTIQRAITRCGMHRLTNLVQRVMGRY